MRSVENKKLFDYIKIYGLLIESCTEEVDVLELKMDFLKGESAVVRSVALIFQKALRD